MSIPTLPVAPVRSGPVGALRRPWVRLLIMIVLFVAVAGLTDLADTAVDGIPVIALAVGLGGAGGALWVYRRAVWFTEHRDVTELDPIAAKAGLRSGTLMGLALFAAVITVLAVLGDYRITGWGSVGAAVAALGTMACVAVTEEILFRGIVFRLVEEMVGTRGALAFSALLFGGLHLINPHATIWGAIAIALEAGLMLGAAYTATGSLWLPIGIHFGWNLAEGGIFATTVSGSHSGETGLFHSMLTGPAALTGGAFGPEASLVAILACAVPVTYYLRQADRRGNLRPRPTRAGAALAPTA